MAGRLIQTPHDQLTYRVIGAAMAVHREHGPGLREDTYQRGLEARLTETGFGFQPQKLIEVFDSAGGGVLIGYYVPDFVVEDRLIVEIKALSALDNAHVAQVIGYLTVTGCPLGLLVNFGARSLQWRRILRPTKIAESHVNRQWLFVPDWLKER